MKNFKKTRLFAAILIALVVSWTGCDKNNSDPAQVALHFDYVVNGEAFQPGKAYLIGGTAVKFDVANFYVGGIEFFPETGDSIPVSGKHLLVTPENTDHIVTTLDPGHYHQLHCFIGVDMATNNQSESDFTNRPSDDPLAAQDPSMAWSWGSGYKFIRIDGQVDTDGDGTPETPLQFHLGDPDPTDDVPKFRRDLAFVIHKDVASGDNVINIQFDLARCFQNIDLSAEYITHVGDNVTLANSFFGNLDKAFSVE
ncbi:MAG: hypothetical protein D6714_03395 [Bacteroidetes bacterium]|nr:MAG: hypothetical protein D6714_03395 [Bacteroidota bacterium]